MFVNEKELVEKLVLDLQDRFDTRYIVPVSYTHLIKL